MTHGPILSFKIFVYRHLKIWEKNQLKDKNHDILANFQDIVQSFIGVSFTQSGHFQSQQVKIILN